MEKQQRRRYAMCLREREREREAEVAPTRTRRRRSTNVPLGQRAFMLQHSPVFFADFSQHERKRRAAARLSASPDCLINSPVAFGNERQRAEEKIGYLPFSFNQQNTS